ncbi:hypothetical protein [Ensifer aridi]|uniref:hypothetical protein n=1 Tax=Ensifer aridi TaxID=1708715 RepID=UPI00358F04F4
MRKYIAAIPVSGRGSCAEEQIISAPPVTAVKSTMIANVGAAARDSQSAIPRGAGPIPAAPRDPLLARDVPVGWLDRNGIGQP